MWTIHLKSIGHNRLGVILVVKELRDLSAAAARALVDSGEPLLANGFADEVEEFTLRLRRAGAKIRIERIAETPPESHRFCHCPDCGSPLLKALESYDCPRGCTRIWIGHEHLPRVPFDEP